MKRVKNEVSYLQLTFNREPFITDRISLSEKLLCKTAFPLNCSKKTLFWFHAFSSSVTSSSHSNFQFCFWRKHKDKTRRWKRKMFPCPPKLFFSSPINVIFIIFVQEFGKYSNTIFHFRSWFDILFLIYVWHHPLCFERFS